MISETVAPGDRTQQQATDRDLACKKILFVCSGNTCRSPMAAALFNHLSGGTDCQAASAGVSALSGQPASAPAIEVMRRDYGLDLSEHRARKITAAMVQAADLVLTMKQEHKCGLQLSMPQLAGKIQTLGQVTGQPGHEVCDPYNGQIDCYARTAADLAVMIRRLIEGICGNNACRQKTGG